MLIVHRIFPKASKIKTLGRCPAKRTSSAVSYLKVIVKERANMVLMLTHHVHSAYSRDLKCMEDNKLQQASTARELLKLGGSLGYKFNSGLCELERLQSGELCKHNRDSTADIITIMKTKTGYSPDLFQLSPPGCLLCTHPFPLFSWLHLSGSQSVFLTGPAMSCLPAPQHLFPVPALCQGQLPAKTPIPPAL